MSNDIDPLVSALVLCLSSFEIMELFNYLCLLILNQVATYIVSAKHVHLKILVPDVINQHLHTRTVLLHLHMPAPKKPKTQQKHQFHSSWSSWKYGHHHHDYKDDHEEPELDHENHHEEKANAKPRPEDDKRHRHKYFPVHDYHKDSYLPQSFMDDNDLEQKNRSHDDGFSYAVHEDVNDIPPNTETHSFNYEEGYKKGLETESGHVRTDQTTKFHEDRQEEQGDAEGEGFNEEFETKTDAGRYLVDDVEYENTRDKREQARRRRRVYKT